MVKKLNIFSNLNYSLKQSTFYQAVLVFKYQFMEKLVKNKTKYGLVILKVSILEPKNNKNATNPLFVAVLSRGQLALCMSKENHKNKGKNYAG